MTMSRYFPSLLLILCGLTLATTCRADDSCLKNTWQGELGGNAVTLEFDSWYGPEKQLAGKYYVGDSLIDYFVVPDPQSAGHWRAVNGNGESIGDFSFECRPGQELRGQWRSADGRLQLPLSAEGDAYYHGNRSASLRNIFVAKSASVGGQPYNLLGVATIPGVDTLNLQGPGQGLGNINQDLATQFSSDLLTRLECSAQRRLEEGWKLAAENQYNRELVAVLDDIVVISSRAQTYCERPDPADITTAQMRHISSGEEEWITSWFSAPDTVIADYQETITDKQTYHGTISEIIWQAYQHKDKECASMVTFNLEDRQVWPTPDGLRFQPSAHGYNRHCLAPATVPYSKIAPFLSELGLQRIKSLHRP